jgi:hypothetical protein
MAAAAQTITLPTPTTAAYLGVRVIFKRITNTTAFVIDAGAGTPFMPSTGIVPTINFTFGAVIYQVELVCDGIHWAVIGVN